ncbi:AAA family ATPase [Aliarcobacter cryaerophilus]|uniref:AAA family ATPase n=1 Tax=Aliarcobacter cryaerophilus TaxID=28198 RepID=UPI003DA37C39
MELIYLYIEDYKNIKNQGFNFSSKFTCKYDEVKKTLQIDEKNNHIENFFGENINVTAIVGENGSGKSSVLEVLTLLYWQGLILKREDKTFFIFFDGAKFYMQCENYKNLSSNIKESTLLNSLKNNTKFKIDDIFCPRASMPLISFTNCITDLTTNERFKPLQTYAYFYNGIQPSKPMMDSVENNDNFSSKFKYLNTLDNSFFDFINEKFIFDTYRIEIYFSEIESYIVQLNNEELKELLTFQNQKIPEKELLHKLCIAFFIELISMLLLKNYTKNKSIALEEKNKYLKETIEDDLIQILKKDLNHIDKFKEVYDYCDKKFGKLIDSVKELFSKENLAYIQNEFVLEHPSKDISYTRLLSKYFKVEYDFKSNKLLYMLEKYNILRYNFFGGSSEKYSFLQLSSGEKSYLNLLTNFAYTLNMVQDDYKGILLFDEIELSFHPNWQKKIVKDLLYIFNKALKRKKLELHLILTSHSPFILSDIPKQNIVFLKDGKQVDALEKKQTFGANIHTLLADGFFMDGGLMGEFAKSKIEEVIKYLNDENLGIKSKEEAQKIINIIGEPILKNQLQKMLDSKNLSEVDKIKQDIKALQNRLEELENGKN